MHILIIALKVIGGFAAIGCALAIFFVVALCHAEENGENPFE